VSEPALLALIAAVTSLVVSIVSAALTYFTRIRTDTRIALLQDTLHAAGEERRARRDYEYEARKRLYTEFQPVLFLMRERCDIAFQRIRGGIVEGAKRGRILSPSRLGTGWTEDRYHMTSTIWDLVTPLVYFRIGQQKLTGVDLSVDPVIRWQYLLAREMYTGWTLGNDLADQPPTIAYDDQNWISRQHLLSGYLEQAVDCLIREDGERRFCIRYGDFSDKLSSDPAFAAAMEHFTAPFTDFHPARKPVLWRILLGQVHLYRALMETFDATPESTSRLTHPAETVPTSEWDTYDWRSDESVSRQTAVVDPFTAVSAVLRRRIPDPPSLSDQPS
jgi:hypothetical protein